MPSVETKHQTSRTIFVDGKKLLWDGQSFDSQKDASRQAEAYKHDNFEVRLEEQDGKHFVYTRRLVKEVVLTVR
jgi:hypothetical protein